MISSVVSSGASALSTGPEIMIAAGGLSGGLGSWATGGSFWDGVKQGLITSALNHGLHMAADGIGGGGDPQPPYSPDLLTKIKAYADANGMVMDGLILMYEVGKLENGQILPLEQAIPRGAKLLGFAGTIVGTTANIYEFSSAIQNKTSIVPSALKITIGLRVATKANPYIAAGYSILEVTGITDLMFNQVPKIPAYTRQAVDYGGNKLSKVPQLQYQKLYR
jgi:hypothetical protein